MNDSVFRSSPSAPLAYSNAMIDPRTPRYSPSIAYDDSLRMTYFDRPYNDPLNPHYQPGSAYDRSAYGYEGIDELVRRYISPPNTSLIQKRLLTHPPEEQTAKSPSPTPPSPAPPATPNSTP